MMIRRLLAGLSLMTLAACSGSEHVPTATISDFGPDISPPIASSPARKAGTVRYGATVPAGNPRPNWCSAHETGNLACIQTATDVAAAIGDRVYASGGYSSGQNLDTPNLSGAVINAGTASGTDTSAAIALASSATTSRTLAAHFADVMHVRDYGVKCDGTTDDAAAINALFASGPIKNKLLLFPAGVCVIRSTITPQLNNAGFEGAGRGQTLFLYQGVSTTNDIIFVPTGTFAATIGGFDVESSTTMTAGNALHVFQARYTTVRDVSTVAYNETTNTLWNGVYLDQPDFIILNRFRSWVQNAALAVSANGAGTSYQYDVFATDGKLYGSKFGVEISGIDNAMFDNIMDTSNTYNVAVDNVLSNYASQELYFGPHFTSDQAGMWGLWLNDSKCSFTPNYGIVDFRGAITGSKNDGVHVQNWPNCSLRLDSPHISKNGNDGVHIADSTAHVAISPATYLENNAQWAVNAEFFYGHLGSSGIALGNGSGGMNPASILAPGLIQTQDNNVPQYTTATVPVCSTPQQLGERVYFIDGTKQGEAAGAGTGTLGYCTKNSAGSYEWLRVSNDTPISQ